MPLLVAHQDERRAAEAVADDNEEVADVAGAAVTKANLTP
jgi:hypothetical protein